MAPLHLVDPRTLRTYCGATYVASPSFGPTWLCSVCKLRKESDETKDHRSTVRRGVLGRYDGRGREQFGRETNRREGMRARGLHGATSVAFRATVEEVAN